MNISGTAPQQRYAVSIRVTPGPGHRAEATTWIRASSEREAMEKAVLLPTCCAVLGLALA